MFAYIRGRLDYKNNDFLIVESNGVGYRIFTSLSTIAGIGEVGGEVKVYTYLYVREDNISLYGFVNQEELNVFELLISVSGVGPKAAISVLSAISPSRFSLAVITDDIKTLTKAQGIGKKIAQRIILELKDKINKEQLTSNIGIEADIGTSGGDDSKVSEAISALMVLGYTPAEANKAVSAVYTEDMDIETIIKNALKGLARP
ncbi:Holliday junction branch migration protein RuvA [Acetivibrio mesophilus]|uniref:Holliday junction branch migration complex subunit RuvA n=1 Tax=Acetivibrio mesophilus TaxID=2487273 RepID=A0A4Q0I201_9FIRM|nr:Holliday junction branch migration protein RuvA [Acetivibrio mesophilus]RXE58186.1 Holliday junction branch migration protein RuvA [Acetivibrio mesophilus]HHV29240.1 Holliday junction branch migration protein RuvA [Clostridium sp.]